MSDPHETRWNFYQKRKSFSPSFMNKKWRFFINGQFLNVSGFFTQTLGISLLRIMKPVQKTMHQDPDMINGQAIFGTPHNSSLWLLVVISVTFWLHMESWTLSVEFWSLLAELSSGKNGWTKNVAAKNPTPINECKAKVKGLEI